MEFKIYNGIIDFLAYAPLHKFKGKVDNGLNGKINIDFDKNEIIDVNISIQTEFFDTGDFFKNKEMHKYIDSKNIETVSFKLKKFKSMKKLKGDTYQIALIGILKFMNIERDLELKFQIEKKEDKIFTKLKFVWSFKNYGLKPPQLLFIKVKDKLDIIVNFEFQSIRV